VTVRAGSSDTKDLAGSAVLETGGLGRRYGRLWALRDCSLSVPAGRVVGLVGPNGAGKTTLLHLVTGLLRPTTGTVRVFGRSPWERAVRARVGFVAQDKPLYRGFTVAESLMLGRRLNPVWDQKLAEDRLAQAGVPAGQRVGALSGGQRAQVALALALAKRPELLLLDEPVADLDPLARKEFMQTLMTEVEDSGLTVVLSSHVVAELDQVADHLVLLTSSHVQLAGDIDTLLGSHKLLVGTRSDTHERDRNERDRASGAAVPDAEPGTGPHTVIQASHAGRQTTLLVRLDGPLLDPAWQVRPVGLEQLVLAYMRHAATPRPAPATMPPTRPRPAPRDETRASGEGGGAWSG
jgi:ABC-2 type transport system ATP-binding protein